MRLDFSQIRFADFILQNRKSTTIRKDSRNRWTEGAPIDFWVRRAPIVFPEGSCFGHAVVSKVVPIKIFPLVNTIVVDGIMIADPKRLNEFAVKDGFDDWNDMKNFFPEDFKGKLITWKEFNL